MKHLSNVACGMITATALIWGLGLNLGPTGRALAAFAVIVVVLRFFQINQS